MAGNDGPSSSALVRKRTDTELMPPPPLPKPIKRPKTVLDEDTYAEGLSKIIARDFFPGLVESEIQNEYLDALDSKDQAWISSAGERVREAMTPGRQRRRGRQGQQRGTQSQPQSRSRSQTPSVNALRSPSVGYTPRPEETPRNFAGETPASVRSDMTADSRRRAAAGDKQGSEKDAVNTDVSLGTYQAKYTSEDNESFHKLLDRQNLKRAEKHAWLWNGNKLPSRMQIKQREVQDRLLESGRHSLVDDGYKKDRLAISDGADQDRPAAPDSWKFQAKSALMFHPDGVDEEGSIETVAQQAQAASRAPPRSIVYANTRLLGTSLAADEAADDRPRPPSPSLSAVRDALAGRPRRGDRDSTFGSTVAGGETPRVNGYAFVDDEPEADQARPASDQGQGQPIKFAPADATPNPFQLQAKSKREGLHHRMVERIAQSKRTSARVGMTGRVSESPSPATPYPNSPRVSGNLTPAGQRLWSKIGGSRRYDPVAAFNRSGKGPRNPAVGSRRARLREQRNLYG